jgi:hypothetical protein
MENGEWRNGDNTYFEINVLVWWVDYIWYIEIPTRGRIRAQGPGASPPPAAAVQWKGVASPSPPRGRIRSRAMHSSFWSSSTSWPRPWGTIPRRPTTPVPTAPLSQHQIHPFKIRLPSRTNTSRSIAYGQLLPAPIRSPKWFGMISSNWFMYISLAWSFYLYTLPDSATLLCARGTRQKPNCIRQRLCRVPPSTQDTRLCRVLKKHSANIEHSTKNESKKSRKNNRGRAPSASARPSPQPGHILFENRKPNRIEPKFRFFWLFSSVSVPVLGNFGFGGRLRFWCSPNRTPESTELQSRFEMPEASA